MKSSNKSKVLNSFFIPLKYISFFTAKYNFNKNPSFYLLINPYTHISSNTPCLQSLGKKKNHPLNIDANHLVAKHREEMYSCYPLSI